jgi:hypothetical protein
LVYITIENKSTVTNNIVINSLSIKEVGEVTVAEQLNYNVATSAVTIPTGNINIPIVIKGVTYYLKANTEE